MWHTFQGCAPFTRLTLPLPEALDSSSSLATAGASCPSALHAGILPGLSSQRISHTVTASMILYVELSGCAHRSPSCPSPPLPLTQTVTSLPAPLQAALSLGRRGRYRCLERRLEHLQSLSFYAMISEEACDVLIYGGSNKS